MFKIAKAQHFKVYLDGEGTDALCIHPPRGQPVNDEIIRKVYMFIDEGTLHSGTTQIRYFAYANGNGMVTYIEPDYSYRGL